MDAFIGPCPHRSIPVEMDESMTSSLLDLAWPPSCQQCRGLPERNDQAATDVGQWRPPESQSEPRAASHDAPTPRFVPSMQSGQMKRAPPAGVWPHGFSEQVPLYERWHDDVKFKHSRSFASPSNYSQDCSLEEGDRLEPPLPLMSDVNYTHCPLRYPIGCFHGPNQMPGNFCRQGPCCPPANLPHPNNKYNHFKHEYLAEPHQGPQHHQWSGQPSTDRPQIKGAPNAPHGSDPQYVIPPRDVMHEVSVDCSHQVGPGPGTREIRRTINLPDECRNVFITYSMDTAEEIIPFVKFLTVQGFEPAIDIFDNPIRRMDTTKWMDRFLNDKSVLIIVVISPKYKEDVDGDGDDEHGLHTKYIHKQIQNEFIEYGCRNFRLVPVLFPYAAKRHVPSWLQSTRIYRWPLDSQDLLLRLCREERYIIPQRGADLTVTVRPI